MVLHGNLALKIIPLTAIKTFGTVTDNLWSSAQIAKMDGNLIRWPRSWLGKLISTVRYVKTINGAVVESVRVGEKHIGGEYTAGMLSSDSYKAIFFGENSNTILFSRR